MIWDNWLLDITLGDTPPCFVPYEPNGDIVFGMNVISNECPGNLVGIVHTGGQDKVEAYIANHPNWHEKFSSKNKVGVK